MTRIPDLTPVPDAPEQVALPFAYHVQGGGVGYWAEGQVFSNGEPGVVLRLEHSTGSTILLLPTDLAEQMCEGITIEIAAARKLHTAAKRKARRATAAASRTSRSARKSTPRKR